MMNSNYCVGCFFAGTPDGYMPECNCCRKDNAIIGSVENNEAAVDMLEYVDELLPNTKQYDTRQDAKKARRMQRRIAAKKYAKKAPKSLAIVNAKLNRLPFSASCTDFEVATKKCHNADKTSVYSYQTSITLAFPEIPIGTSWGHGKGKLIYIISGWKYNKKASAEMKVACSDALRILETVFDYHGELVGLHCERCDRDDDGKKINAADVDVLQIKIGFSDKVSLAEFIRKTAAA